MRKKKIESKRNILKERKSEKERGGKRETKREREGMREKKVERGRKKEDKEGGIFTAITHWSKCLYDVCQFDINPCE